MIQHSSHSPAQHFIRLLTLDLFSQHVRHNGAHHIVHRHMLARSLARKRVLACSHVVHTNYLRAGELASRRAGPGWCDSEHIKVPRDKQEEPHVAQLVCPVTEVDGNRNSAR